MKSLVTVATVLVFGFFSISSSAQYMGVRTGVGISNLITSTNSNSTFGRLFSVHVGATIDFEIADRFWLQSGTTFFKKGGANAFGNFNLYYLELPVTARFDFLEVGAEGILYARAGFYSGMLLTANFNGTKLDVGSRPGDDFKFFDFGIISGVGYGFNESIDVGLAVEFGFLNTDAEQSTVSLTNGAIMITANYRFGL